MPIAFDRLYLGLQMHVDLHVHMLTDERLRAVHPVGKVARSQYVRSGLQQKLVPVPVLERQAGRQVRQTQIIRRAPENRASRGSGLSCRTNDIAPIARPRTNSKNGPRSRPRGSTSTHRHAARRTYCLPHAKRPAPRTGSRRNSCSGDGSSRPIHDKRTTKRRLPGCRGGRCTRPYSFRNGLGKRTDCSLPSPDSRCCGTARPLSR